jgi:hypothetical protein
MSPQKTMPGRAGWPAWLPGLGLALVAALLPSATAPALSQSETGPVLFDYDGSKDPFPIPWLDANGSHNQMPGVKQEPSHIYHFKGLVARCNGFAGKGTDRAGNPVSFGTKTTDFGIMVGEYYAGRTVHKGAFVHL